LAHWLYDQRLIGVTRRIFWRHAGQRAARLGGKLLTIQSDPQAEGFYRSMGAQPTGKRETGSIPGRQLPALTMCLEISDIA
jgi:hypothetical protein